jgi:glutathione S-transferase
MIKITAFKMVPPFAQGLVRDLRVRWALEEAGLSYETELVDGTSSKSAAYRERQPFGQVPVLEEDGLVLFESGAILLHLGAESDALLPAEPKARARAVAWVFAALNSIEIAIQPLAEIDLFHKDESWTGERRPQAEAFTLERLGLLAGWLGDREYLEGRFTAGDLMMAAVLRILRHTDLVARFPTLTAYLARCEARPAFQRALRAQLAVFEQHAEAS